MTVHARTGSFFGPGAPPSSWSTPSATPAGWGADFSGVRVPRLLQGVVGLLSRSGAVTHEGAAAFDLSIEHPQQHLAFTKGAALLERTFYRSQAAEIRSYAQALLAAERVEPGFAWKFAAYVRDPERGKGNRIQGSVAPAILAAADPDGPFTEEYTFRCLRHRADDVALFVAHGKNLGLGDVPAAAKRGMARALSGFDDYQLLKYAQKQFPLLERRKNGARKTLRLVDAMGLCKAELDPRTRRIYEYLHASTRERAEKAAGIPLLEARRRFFRGSGAVDDFVAGRLTIEQALSFLGNRADTWRRIFDVPGLLGDLAFMRNLRSMAIGGIPASALVAEARKRRFEGVWPHQVYAGWRAATGGSARTVVHRGSVPVFQAAPRPELEPVFDAVLGAVASTAMPGEASLGLADVSGSMFGAPLGGAKSSMFAGDVSVLLAAMMAQKLGYAAGFSDDVIIVDASKNETPFRLAERLRRSNAMGGTQVAGSVRSLLAILLAEPERPRPRTLYFFSDMQFHPPASQTFAPQWGGGRLRPRHAELVRALPPLDPRDPPLLALLKMWRERLGPVDVVLWNLATYDNAPVPSGMDHVLMLAGFDAQSFRHVAKWQAAGSAGGTARPRTDPDVALPAGPSRDPEAELDVIRTF